MTGDTSIALTMGDPAGIGPLITVAAVDSFSRKLATCELVVIGDQASLIEAALRTGRQWRGVAVSESAFADGSATSGAGAVAVVEPELNSPPDCRPGIPTVGGGRLQVAAIDAALRLVRAGRVQAIVTGPVSKISISRAGVPFTGHTEYLAGAAGLDPEDVTMMFAGPRLKIALVTTHLPLRDVPQALTPHRLLGTIGRVVKALVSWWKVLRPRIVVLGLNPHAGEEGLFGSEEAQIISPAVELARKRFENVLIEGPIPTEAGLGRAIAGEFDCVVAHYHDQATIPAKLLERGRAVNVTLGLPFPRTSVDHGVAYDAAVEGAADPSSLEAALELAVTLARARPDTG